MVSPRLASVARTCSTSRSLAVKFTQIGSSCTMVASVRRRAGADQLADRDLPRGHDAVERRGDVGVAEIDLGLLLVGLRRLQVGLR